MKVITRAVVDGKFVGHVSSSRQAGGEPESTAAANSVEQEFESLGHEIQIMARLSHPNVVRCLGGCLRPPRVFVVQELMSGTLATLLHNEQQGVACLPLPSALKLMLDVARGLQYLHSMSVVHRFVHRLLAPALADSGSMHFNILSPCCGPVAGT